VVSECSDLASLRDLVSACVAGRKADVVSQFLRSANKYCLPSNTVSRSPSILPKIGLMVHTTTSHYCYY
jgi:hypothetical protein